MSFGTGFGGFGQNNPAQPTGFGGFGASNNNTTGTGKFVTFSSASPGIFWTARLPWIRLLTDHQDSVHHPTMPSAPAIPIPLLDYSAAVRLQVALEQTQAVHSGRPTTPLDRRQALVLRPLRAAEEASLGHRPQQRPAVQASVDSVPPTRRAPRHHLAEAVHPSSAVPISQPPPSGPPQHLPRALPFSVVETPAVLLGLQVLLALGQPTTRA